jgi:hypothetical protein
MNGHSDENRKIAVKMECIPKEQPDSKPEGNLKASLKANLNAKQKPKQQKTVSQTQVFCKSKKIYVGANAL